MASYIGSAARRLRGRSPTAKALGLTVPAAFLAGVDEVIE